MKRLFTILLSMAMLLLCYPAGVRADEINLHMMEFYAENGRIITSEFGEREENPYVYLVSEGKQIGMYVHAVSNDPEKQFAGWATSKDGDPEFQEWELYEYVPTDNMKFYAVFMDTYDFTLDGNGGYFWGDPEATQAAFTVPKGLPVQGQYTFPQYPDSSKALVGWAYSPDGEIVSGKSLYGFEISGDTVLYAVWADAYELTLDSNGHGSFTGSSKTISVAVAKNQKVDSYYEPYIEEDDIMFAGWSFTPDGDVDLNSDQLYNYIMAGPITLYAVWTEKCVVTLKANGGYFPYELGDTQVIQFAKGMWIDGFVTPLNENQTLMFAGWSHSPDGPAEYAGNTHNRYHVEGDDTLYAIWTEVYVITLDANGGYFNEDKSKVTTYQVVPGNSLDWYYQAEIDDPHSVLTGWSYTKNGKVDIDEYQLYDFVPQGSVTLYAVWAPGYSITFKTNEGYFDYLGNKTTKERTLKFAAGRNLDSPSLANSNSHRAVLGWALTDGGPVQYYEDYVWMNTVDKDMTLYAVWADSFEVTLDANGGLFGYEGNKEVTQKKVGVLKDHGLTGYQVPYTGDGREFIGWSLTPDGAIVKLYMLPITKDTTLYARYGEPVDRIFGNSRFDTSMLIADALKEEKGIDKFDSIILTSGLNYADALAGSYLSYVKDAPILITADMFGGVEYYKQVNAYIKKNLKAGGTVYVLGGTAAVSDKAIEELKKDFSIRRLAGSNRYETNIRILEEANVKDEDILVCTGYGFADSLSASAAKRPILLVGSSLSADQKAYLNNHKKNKYYAIGGDKAVTSEVENELKAYGSVKRLAGSTRHETSVMIAEEFCPNADNVVMAFSYNFPDGLCGGPLAAAKNAPIILTRDGNEDIAAAWCKKHNITEGLALGGYGLISDEAAFTVLSE